MTGRRQLELLPAKSMMSMSFSNYADFIRQHTLSTNQEQTSLLKHTGEKVSKAVEQYMAEHGMSKRLKGFSWEFNLVEDPTVNAWCMPGGKVVFYSGIMPVCQDQSGIAVVMGHEIGHAIANHGDERMSQSLVMELGGIGLMVSLRDKPAETQGLFLAAYGVGTTVGAILPYSRLQESEADYMGLVFMAMAGYNPEKAITFWERMAAQSKGITVPALLSTHPPDLARIKKLKEKLPEAMTYYRPELFKN